MSALYPSLEDMKVDQMAQVCLCLYGTSKCFIASVAVSHATNKMSLLTLFIYL